MFCKRAKILKLLKDEGFEYDKVTRCHLKSWTSACIYTDLLFLHIRSIKTMEDLPRAILDDQRGWLVFGEAGWHHGVKPVLAKLLNQGV